MGRFFRVFRSCLEEELAGHRIEWRYTRQLSYRLVDRRLRRSEQNYLINHARGCASAHSSDSQRILAPQGGPWEGRGRGGRHRLLRAVANDVEADHKRGRRPHLTSASHRSRSKLLTFLSLSWCVVGTAFGRACLDAIGQGGVDAEIGVCDCEGPSHEAMLVADVEARLTGPRGEMPEC